MRMRLAWKRDNDFHRTSSSRRVTDLIKRTLFLLIVASLTNACGRAVFAESEASAEFRKLQSLAGEWEEKNETGNDVKAKCGIIAGGTAVMETLSASGMELMVTLYSMDGDSILLLHYCPTNNQPRMRAIPAGVEINELVFSFQGAANLPSLAVGHEHKLVMQFRDKDRITEGWTWRQKGKDIEMVYHLARERGR